MQSEIRKIAWFLLICFALTYGIGFALLISGGGLGRTPLPVGIMLIPMISAFCVQRLIAREPIFRGGRLGFRLGRPIYLLVAPLVCFLTIAIICVITFSLNPDLLVDKGTLEENVKQTDINIINKPVAYGLLFIIFINLFVAPIINLPLYWGEEVGWRGFLYPSLVSVFKNPGLLIGGAIWGLWHLPMVLMGLNYPSNPALGVLFMIIFCTSWGIILQFLYQKSGSILSVGLAHGMMNWTGTTVMHFIVVEGKMDTFLEGSTGVIGLVVASVVAFYCYTKYPSDSENGVSKSLKGSE